MKPGPDGPYVNQTDGAKRVKRDYRQDALQWNEGKVLFDASMKRFTSFRIGGPADCLFFPQDVDGLRKVVLQAAKRGVPLFILGKGTNLLVRDGGIRGWVVSLTQGMKKIRSEGETLEAEAGATLQQLVRVSVQKGLAGLEPFYGIPGSVGGGLAMNAGAWGAEIKDVLESVSFLDEDGEEVTRPRSRLHFSYRSMDFPSRWIIVRGRFRLKRCEKGEIVAQIKSYAERRRVSQPLDYPSAGSVFKNTEKGPAGRWIEASGLKGFRIGQAMVSDRHANFIVNLGKATAKDVIELMEWVERKVHEATGISLEREVKVVGE